MKPPGWHAMLWLAALAAAAPGRAQQVAPHVGYVYPAGGRQGATVDVTIGGQFLNGVNNVIVSGSGIEAAVMEHNKPLTPAQFNKLRDQLKELMEKRAARQQGKGAWTPEDEKLIAEIRTKIAAFIRRPANPAIAETVTVRIAVAADAAPGDRELRLETPAGLTNPLVFRIGTLPEFSKPAVKATREPPARKAARPLQQVPGRPLEPPMNVTLPAVINGQIMPGAVDRFRFKAAKGQRLVFAASARELMPYISDAVPGWFQAILALYDAGGKEVGYAGNWQFHPDPVLYYEAPDDGEYVLEVKDSIYRGREDFVYRIIAGELPFVTGIFPLGGRAGARTTVEVRGWNLPAAKITQDGKGKGAGIQAVSMRSGSQTSNAEPFALDTLAERMDREPNNLSKGAQKLKLPVIVNGRIDRPGDQDVFRFDGRAGEEIVAEVFARRLDSPLDSVLELTDAAGRQLAANDDHEDKGAGLITHQADSRVAFRLPAKGTYYLHLGDTQGKGGAEYAYRLRVSRPQPDFELRVTPASVNVRGGATVPITVYALRRDGFQGDIALRLKDAPDGFTLSGGWIPGDEEKARLTLTVPPDRWERPLSLHIEGRAAVNGKEVSRAAVPAEDMMQAFAYHHLVPAKEWMVRVTGPGRPRGAWKPVEIKPVKLPSGGTAPVRLAIPVPRMANQVRLALNEPPEGIAIQSVTPMRDGLAVVLCADVGKAKPGLKGNLIVDAFLERPPAGNPQGARRRAPLGTLPAIPFEVVRP